MNEPRTAAERYLAERRAEPGGEAAYQAARSRIDRIDAIMRRLDEHRRHQEWSKAELGRRSGLDPAAIRRLFSTASPNPTLSTLVALADSMGLEVDLKPTAGR